MSLRVNLIIVALLGAAIAVISFSGEVKSLGALAYLVRYNPRPTDVNLIAAQDTLRILYDYWYYLRFAAIVLAILAMRALVKTIKPGGVKPQTGSPGPEQISPS